MVSSRFWFQIVVCFVALILLILPAALSRSTFCCAKKNERRVSDRTLEAPELREEVVYRDVLGWKDIANILTITCFSGCFFFFFFFLQVDAFVLLYIELSAD